MESEYLDICDSDDQETLARFRTVLALLGAKRVNHAWVPDVDLYEFEIAGELLSVFADPWLINVKGTPELLRKIEDGMKKNEN